MELVTVFAAVLLCLICVTGQQSETCSSGFSDPLMGEQQRNRRQYIFPFMNFSCHGYITKWIFYATCFTNNTLTPQYPEFQIWRLSPDGSEYKRVGYTRISSDSDLEGDFVCNGTRQYTYTVRQSEPMCFQPGDVVGVHTPRNNRVNRNTYSRLRLRFADDDSQLSYYQQRGDPQSELLLGEYNSTSRDIPMMTPTFNFTSTPASLKTDICTSRFPDLSGQTKEPNRLQYVFPFMMFSCYGRITQWSFTARYQEDSTDEPARVEYPEFQIWRPSNCITYEKVSQTSINSDSDLEGEFDDNQTITYTVDQSRPMCFQPGDVVGVHTPRNNRAKLSLRFKEVTDGSLSFSKKEQDEPLSELSLIDLEASMDIPMVTVQIAFNDTSTCATTAGSVPTLALTIGVAAGVCLVVVLIVIILIATLCLSVYFRLRQREEETSIPPPVIQNNQAYGIIHRRVTMRNEEKESKDPLAYAVIQSNPAYNIHGVHNQSGNDTAENDMCTTDMSLGHSDYDYVCS